MGFVGVFGRRAELIGHDGGVWRRILDVALLATIAY